MILFQFVQEIDSSVEKRVEELKREVKKMMRHANEPLQKMTLVDAIQRLALGYDFEQEIDVALKQINDNACTDDDLHAFALRFRLLRQWGYNTPSDGFKKFTNEHDKFNESLSSDARGLLSLYEAAHLGLPGEDILDEAIVFTMHHLPLIKNNNKVSVSLAMDIERALHMPLRKGLERLQARQCISIYEKDEQQNDVLLELAKLDYNRVQRLLQKELKNISVNYLKKSVHFFFSLFFFHFFNLFFDIEKLNKNDFGDMQTQIKDASRLYLQEAKWGAERYAPTFEEHLSVTVQSSGYPMLHCATLVGLEDINLTKEVYDWVITVPKLLHFTALHSRLMDDIADVEQDKVVAKSYLKG
ncbi:putative terpene synthase 2 [Acorus gramineus]|uniref:Terpene synthase 2 n=1 Tax=Acorus gramineus TaxID=55184 RepID=A0AAV8ZYP4_ACOGR|nr:putative terpene synthase 2 [Acorus gramineus]